MQDPTAHIHPTPFRSPTHQFKSFPDELSPDVLPVLCLPEPLAFLIFKQAWGELLLLARWHSQLYGPHGALRLDRLPLFPTISWPRLVVLERASQDEDVPESPPHTAIPNLAAPELMQIANQLRNWSTRILSSCPESELQAESDALKRTIGMLDAWSSSLATATGGIAVCRAIVPDDCSGFIHSSIDMFRAVQAYCLLFASHGQ